MLRKEEVSAHYIIGRDGDVENIVPEDKRAWHAGKSHYPFNTEQSADVNDISIGVELVTTNDLDFTEKQYEALTKLIQELMVRYLITFVVGHEHIAHRRSVPKRDPGDKFDWSGVVAKLSVNTNYSFVYRKGAGIKLEPVNIKSPERNKAKAARTGRR